MKKKLLALIIIPFILILTACGLTQSPEDAAYRITKEQWESIDEITNYSLKINVTSKDNGNVITINKTIKSKDNAFYYYSIQNNQNGTTSEEYFYIIEDEQQYVISQWNAAQNKYDNLWHAYERELESISMNDALGFGLDIKYRNLRYDKDTKAYTYTKKEDNFIGIISYNFVDGTLAKVTANVYEASNVKDINQENAIETIEALFYAVGTTKFGIPQYTIQTEN